MVQDPLNFFIIYRQGHNYQSVQVAGDRQGRQVTLQLVVGIYCINNQVVIRFC
ncbi:hypothetical protein SDC9_202349 [bioreactor metagenome]|uniref:Uncharacterized protein n=1 Tax=bioreactor metagenome TaxID=1076179 RepID=A0A645IUZ5_9ZZZZ